MLKEFILLSFFGCIVGSTAFAAETSYLVKNPSLGNGVYFSSSSDEDVLCQALGYERAAVGSASFELDPSSEGKLISIDEFGDLSGSSLTPRVKSIVCVNWILPPVRKTHLVHRPSHPKSKALFTDSSHEKGVCTVSGFKNGIKGTIIADTNASGPRVTVDESGRITGGASEDAPFIESIICLSNTPSPIVKLEPYFSTVTRFTSSWFYELSLEMKLDPKYVHSAPNTRFDVPYRLSKPHELDSEGDISFSFFPILKKYEDSYPVDSFRIYTRAGNTPRGKLILHLGTVGNPLATISIPLPNKPIESILY